MWSCHDECAYRCMWRTTNAFIARQWDVPQFYGKWPFKRFFGIQEPASVLFSLLNLIVHWKMLRKFRKVVRSDSPMYYVWHVFCAVRTWFNAFSSSIHSILDYLLHLDFHEWLDVFDNFPFTWFSTHRTTWLWICLFNGLGQFLLYVAKVWIWMHIINDIKISNDSHG